MHACIHIHTDQRVSGTEQEYLLLKAKVTKSMGDCYVPGVVTPEISSESSSMHSTKILQMRL